MDSLLTESIEKKCKISPALFNFSMHEYVTIFYLSNYWVTGLGNPNQRVIRQEFWQVHAVTKCPRVSHQTP
jgi:hypothetical protein